MRTYFSVTIVSFVIIDVDVDFASCCFFVIFGPTNLQNKSIIYLKHDFQKVQYT